MVWGSPDQHSETLWGGDYLVNRDDYPSTQIG